MPGRWHHLDALQLDHRLRDVWAAGGETRLGSLSGGDRLSGCVDVGAYSRAPGHLPDPAVPRREASFEEVAPPSLALWSGDRLGEPRHRSHARTVARPRRCAQPVRARKVPLGSRRGARRYPATPPVHARLGFKLGVTLPSKPRESFCKKTPGGAIRSGKPFWRTPCF